MIEAVFRMFPMEGPRLFESVLPKIFKAVVDGQVNAYRMFYGNVVKGVNNNRIHDYFIGVWSITGNLHVSVCDYHIKEQTVF